MSNSKINCTYCNLPIIDNNATIYGPAPWQNSSDPNQGSHWSCENKAEHESEIAELDQMIWAEAKYRSAP